MYAYFKKDGTLKIKPHDHGEAKALKEFIKELQTHGVKMLDVDSDYDDHDPHVTDAYSRSHAIPGHVQGYPAYGYMPHPPMSVYWPPEFRRLRKDYGYEHDDDGHIDHEIGPHGRRRR